MLLPIDIATYTEVDEHGEAYGGVHMDYPGRAKVFQRIDTSGLREDLNPRDEDWGVFADVAGFLRKAGRSHLL